MLNRVFIMSGSENEVEPSGENVENVTWKDLVRKFT